MQTLLTVVQIVLLEESMAEEYNDSYHSCESGTPTPTSPHSQGSGSGSSSSEEDEWVKIPGKNDELVIVVTGRSGAGKSTLINNLLENGITEELSPSPNTLNINSKKLERNGVTIHIVDTPGLKTHKKDKRKQLKAASCHEDAKRADLILFCVPVGPSSKFDICNPEIMESLHYTYGRGIWSYCIIVFTFSNHALEHWRQIGACKGGKSGEAADVPETKYEDYLLEYAKLFQKHLREKLGVEEARVRTVFDREVKEEDIVAVPAGRRLEDQVTPGVATDEEGWSGIIFREMLKKGREDSKVALLRYRYGRNYVREAWRRFNLVIKDSQVAQVVMGVAGGGGLVLAGAAIGAGVGLAGGPIGIAVGATLGATAGVVATGMAAAAGTASVKVAKELVGKEASKKKP